MLLLREPARQAGTLDLPGMRHHDQSCGILKTCPAGRKTARAGTCERAEAPCAATRTFNGEAGLTRPGTHNDPVTEDAPEDGPFAHWHVDGLCDRGCHQPGNGPRKSAAYWWLAPNGYWFTACEECCATDRAIAAECPDLAPLRVLTYQGRT